MRIASPLIIGTILLLGIASAVPAAADYVPGTNETDTYRPFQASYAPPAHLDTCAGNDVANEYTCPIRSNDTCTDVAQVIPSNPPMYHDRSVQCVSTAHLNVTKTGTGTGVITDTENFNCGARCHSDYGSSGRPQLTATPDPGSKFDHWEGDCTGTQLTCSLPMSTGRNVEAVFTSTAPVCNGIKGDVNNNGIVDNTDVLIVRRYLIEAVTLDTCEIIRADVDCRDSVTNTDALIMNRYLIEQVTEFCAMPL